MGKKKQRVGLETRKRVKDAHKERQRELKLSSHGRKKLKTILSGLRERKKT